MKKIIDDSALSTINSLLASYASLGIMNVTGSFTDVTVPAPTSHSIDNPKVMMLLFARWITTNFGTPEYNVNGFDGQWWKDTLEHFITNVYPHMKTNGSVKATEDFLNS